MMNYKSITALFLGATLLTIPQFCFAMEKEDAKPNQLKIDFENSNEFLGTLAKVSRERYTATLKEQDSLKKAQNFGKNAKFLELNMPEVLKINDPFSIETLTQLWANNLCKQGIVLHNVAQNLPHPGTPMEERVELWKEAIEITRKSYKLYKGLGSESQKEASETLQNLGDMLTCRGLGMSVCADKETDPEKIIGLIVSALSLGTESYKIYKTLEKERQIKVQFLHALHRGFLMYNQIASHIEIFHEPDTSAKYTTLVKNSSIIEKVFSLFRTHLLSPPITIDWYIEIGAEAKKKHPMKHSKNLFALTSIGSKGSLSILAPEDCMRLFWGTYCGILKGASNTVSNLMCANDQLKAHYNAKSQEHLEKAVEAYRDHIYQGEYKNNSKKEDEYILANLENLAENENPLLDFYAKLRLEKRAQQEHEIAQMIRDEKEERQRQESAKQKIYEAQRKAVEEQAARQRALQATTTSESTVTQDLPSLHEKEIEPRIQEKIKKKMRGEAHAPAPSLEIMEKKETVITVEPKIITLNPQNYYVFQCLTGKIYDRNISLAKVVTLLKTGFSCKITNATGGGDHRKATAPNNHEWTIPPKWDGPISSYYRGQLMRFLLIKMGINDGLLEVREGK